MGVRSFNVRIHLLVTKTSIVVHIERPDPDFACSVQSVCMRIEFEDFYNEDLKDSVREDILISV